MQLKRSLLVGATIATVTLGGGGIAMAATDSSSASGDSLVNKIAAKFNLNQDEVQAVFDEDRSARVAEMKAQFEERLAQAVTDGDLTQEQADHIKSAQTEIAALRGDTNPRELSDEVRDQIHDKMDELRDWAEDNNVDMQYVMGGRGHGGPGGHGGFGEPRDETDESSDSSDDSSSSDDSGSSSS